MARRSTGKSWLHEKSGYWCTSVDRKRVYLDQDYKVACRKLRQLKADRKRSEQGALVSLNGGRKTSHYSGLVYLTLAVTGGTMTRGAYLAYAV